MIVGQSELAQSLIQTVKHVAPKTDEFSAQLEREMLNTLKTQKEEEQPKNKLTLEEVDAFKKRLLSMGAVAFLQHQNMEKIEKLLEEKRKELEGLLRLNEDANPPLSKEERALASMQLEEMLKDFSKELQEQMGAKTLLEKEKSPLNSLLHG